MLASLLCAPVLGVPTAASLRPVQAVMERKWNGGHVDNELNFPAQPTVLKVRLGRY